VSFDYKSKKWHRAKNDAQRRAGWKCEIESCGRSKRELEGIGLYLVTHHRLDADAFPQFALDPEFLLVVCTECHEQIHGRIAIQNVPEMVQIDWVDLQDAPSLKVIDDMGLFERADRRRAAKMLAAEIQFYKDDYDKRRALSENRDNAALRGRELEQGVLEEYERLRSIGTGDEDDASTTTETTNPGGRGSA
jgi:hypothetical protein